MRKDYVSVQYDIKVRPVTEYPSKLVSHLIQLHNFREGSNLLEVGAGRPDMLKAFQANGIRVHACDISEISKKACKAENIPFKKVDLFRQKLPYRSNSFDIVYSKSVIEHMNNPLEFVSECVRVLKPGGKFITLTPDWNANFKTFFDDFTHVRPFTRRSMSLLLQVSELKKIEVYRFRQLPITWNSRLINLFCASISPFIPANTRRSFFRWSRELMLVGYGIKE